MNNIGCSSSSSCSDEFSLEETHIIELFLDKMIHDKDHPKPLTILFWIVFIVWIVSIIAEVLGFMPFAIYSKIKRIVGWGILIVYLFVALIYILAHVGGLWIHWQGGSIVEKIQVVIFWPVYAVR